MAQPLLHEGEYVQDDHVTDNFVADKLRAENRELRTEVARLKAELHSVSVQNARAVSRLRTVLTPLYRGLQDVFGEMEDFGDASEGAPQIDGRKKAVWESWKQKLPGMPAKFIEALLEHGELNVAQLRVAAHCGQQTVYDTTAKLNKLGLINKNGGRYSLKEL